jgi:hypothetical protein
MAVTIGTRDILMVLMIGHECSCDKCTEYGRNTAIKPVGLQQVESLSVKQGLECLQVIEDIEKGGSCLCFALFYDRQFKLDIMEESVVPRLLLLTVLQNSCSYFYRWRCMSRALQYNSP